MTGDIIFHTNAEVRVNPWRRDGTIAASLDWIGFWGRRAKGG